MKREGFATLQTDFDASFMDDNPSVSHGVLDPAELEDFDEDLDDFYMEASKEDADAMNQTNYETGFQTLGMKEREQKDSFRVYEAKIAQLRHQLKLERNLAKDLENQVTGRDIELERLRADVNKRADDYDLLREEVAKVLGEETEESSPVSTIVAKFQEKINTLKQDKMTLQKEKGDLEREMDGLSDSYQKAHQEFTAKQSRLEELEAEIPSLKEQVASATEQANMVEQMSAQAKLEAQQTVEELKKALTMSQKQLEEQKNQFLQQQQTNQSFLSNVAEDNRRYQEQLSVAHKQIQAAVQENKNLVDKLSNIEHELVEVRQKATEYENVARQSKSVIASKDAELESLARTFDENQKLYEKQIDDERAGNNLLLARIKEFETQLHQMQTSSEMLTVNNFSTNGCQNECCDAQLASYRQQVADFDRLSKIASEEMRFLRTQVETQTYKLRDIEELWRKEKSGIYSMTAFDFEHGNKTREVILEEQRLHWGRVLQAEEAKWRSLLNQLESTVASHEDQIVHLESMNTQKELELVRLKEHCDFLAAKFKEADDAQQLERGRLRKEIERLSKDRDSLQQNCLERNEIESEQQAKLQGAFATVEKIVTTLEHEKNEKQSQINLLEQDCRLLKEPPSDNAALKEELRRKLNQLRNIRRAFMEKVDAIEGKVLRTVESWGAKFDATIDRLRKFDLITKKAAFNQRSLKEKVKLLSKDIESQNSLILELRSSKKTASSDVTALNEKYRDAVGRADASERRAQELEIALSRLDHQLSTAREQAAIEQQGAAQRVEELLHQQRLLQRHVIGLEQNIVNLKERRNLKEHDVNAKEPNNDSHGILEGKENNIKSLRNHYSEAINRLEQSRQKHISREEKYRHVIANTIEYLEKLKGKKEEILPAISLLRNVSLP
ncbi:hypothetical protein HDV05_002059 [Chytridiales sp. JEL 0842]|nr:hypothetical protein HDV05_002059 [Chytridiales sp. JEL 0842]